MKRFSWEPGFDNARLLRNLADCRKVGTDGRVAFDGWDYPYWLPVLESAVHVHEDIGQQLKHGCITRAVNDATVTLKDGDAFLQRCEVAYTQLTARPKQNYIVYFSLTYAGAPLFSRISDGDVSLRWLPKNSRILRKIRKAQGDIARQLRDHKVADEPPESTYLLAYVSAYDAHDAHTLATDSVDCLRGMLNLFVNSNRGINPFGRLRRPHAINRFRSGPYRTLHRSDGSLATETFWYEHPWLHEIPSVTFKTDSFEKFKKQFHQWWGKLQRNPLKNHIKQGLLRFCRALDMHDAEPSLTEMWGALESLTGTQNERGDLTVGRTIQLFRDKDDARQVANHIRVRRNSTIHAARTLQQQEADAILVHAEILVSRVLFFSLKEGKRFADRQELYNFLDLRLDETKLKRTMTLSKFFVEYQSRKPDK